MLETNTSIRIPPDEAAFYDGVWSRQASLLSTIKSPDEIDPSSVDTMIFRCLLQLLRTPKPHEFLQPLNLWVSSVYTCLCEWDAYRYLAPIRGKCVLQAGGTGVAAIQFLLAGAREAWLLTPVEGETKYAMEVARLAGVNLNYRIGVAEDMPFESHSFDAVFTGGCLHHFNIPRALAEISRVLVPGGDARPLSRGRHPFTAQGSSCSERWSRSTASR